MGAEVLQISRLLAASILWHMERPRLGERMFPERGRLHVHSRAFAASFGSTADPKWADVRKYLPGFGNSWYMGEPRDSNIH